MQLTREIIVHTTELDWLAARKLDLTSTEAAALFGASPYATEFELYHRKTGALPDDFTANDRMKWGNRLEAAIAAGVAEDLGLIVEPFKVYMRIPELRMGSSFDFKITGIVDGFDGDENARNMFREHGAGIMEVKNVDGLAFRRTWLDDGEVIEAPPHIEMQVQHQLEVADLNWSIIAPLVGGNTPRPIIRLRDREIGALICQKVAQFWQRVGSGIAPTPNFTADAGTIAKLYVNTSGAEIDLSGNNRLVELCVIRKQASDQAAEANKVKDAATAEILTIIGDAAKVKVAGGFSISAGTVGECEIAYTRRAYRNVRVTQKHV